MTEPGVGADEVRALARSLSALLRVAEEQVVSERSSPLTELITAHLGRPITELPNVGAHWPIWEHANLQRGVDAYLAERSPDAVWFGVSGQGRHHEDPVDMLTESHRHMVYDLGAVDYTTVAVGPDRSIDAIGFGLVCTNAPDGTPVVLAMRASYGQFNEPGCQVQILAVERDTATAARERIEQLMAEHDVFRGQVLSFGVSEHRGNSLVSFQPRPDLDAPDVILPPGVLETVERHVVLPGQHARVLRQAGQHLKRGLLLHGPPGTGKTHTVRYLMSRLTTSTFVVISGFALRMIGEATMLARRLQPSVVVVEDVDLIAEDRSFGPGTNPMLFQLLNEMDGVASDADVTFVLTTNRVEVLERALVDRPGRVDLAVQIPRPDADCRERLLRLYAGGVTLDLPDASTVVERMEGVTASFVRELVRRVILRAADQDGQAVTLTQPALLTALEEFADERGALTRSLLGGVTGEEPAPGLAPPAGPAVWKSPYLHR